jgi:hypothetical protein
VIKPDTCGMDLGALSPLWRFPTNLYMLLAILDIYSLLIVTKCLMSERIATGCFLNYAIGVEVTGSLRRVTGSHRFVGGHRRGMPIYEYRTL